MSHHVFYKLLKDNYERRIKYDLLSAKYGSIEAMINLVKIYYNNNYKIAEKYIDMIIDSNNIKAINEIIKYCKNKKKIHDIYMKAMDNNKDEAMWYSLLLLNKVPIDNNEDEEMWYSLLLLNKV
jgi:hypothetical protein